MLLEQKNNPLSRQCSHIGNEIAYDLRKQEELRQQIRSIENDERLIPHRLNEIQNELRNLALLEASTSELGGRARSRTGRVTGGVIRISLQRAQLERERDKLNIRLAQLPDLKQRAQRDLAISIENENRLREAFNDLGCSASLIYR